MHFCFFDIGHRVRVPSAALVPLRVRKKFGVVAALLLFHGIGHADRLPMSELDVTLPDGWSLNDEPLHLSDYIVSMGPKVAVTRIATPPMWEAGGFESMCTFALLHVGGEDTDLLDRPAWAPAEYASTTIRGTVSGGEATVLCAAHPDGGAFTVMVVPASATYADATPMLEALLGKTPTVARAPAVSSPEPAPAQVAEAIAPYESAPASEEPPVADEPAPTTTAFRERRFHIGVGGEYLDPTGDFETGYGLAVGVGYDRRLGRLGLELRGLYGVDSTAGFWLDMHAHLALALFPGDSYTLSLLGGAGVDGIGKANQQMHVHVPYAPSGQVGGRLAIFADGGAYEAQATLAVRAKGEGEPGGKTRFTLRRSWPARRLASVGASYLRYGESLDRIEILVDFRL